MEAKTYKVFNPEVVRALAVKHQSALQQLADIEQNLQERFSDIDDAIHALILAVASGEPLLFIGPPGTGKSRLIRSFCNLAGLLDLSDLGKNPHPDFYFEYLLTPFTEPGELFGYYNIEAAKDGRLERETAGMMQGARVVYLDEVFNGSSAILNSLLSFIQERVFHDRGHRTKVKMECLFAASNEIPNTSELLAIYDRFLIRCDISNVAQQNSGLDKGLQGLLEKGWSETYGRQPERADTDVLAGLAKLREDIHINTQRGKLKPLKDDDFMKKLAAKIHAIVRYDLGSMSNRRLVKMLYVMLIHSMYESVKLAGSTQELKRLPFTFSDKQFDLLPFFFDRRDELLEKRLRSL